MKVVILGSITITKENFMNFIEDDNKWVRCEIAKKGYGLDILINDSDSWVRKAVAEQGYGLDKLINDES